MPDETRAEALALEAAHEIARFVDFERASDADDFAVSVSERILDILRTVQQETARATWERAARVADQWAHSHSCSAHEDNPCCHVRTGAGIAAAIRQAATPPGEPAMTDQTPDTLRALDLEELIRLLRCVRPRDCGVHYCRYCPAESPKWEHSPSCPYVESQRECEDARAMIATLRALADQGRRAEVMPHNPTETARAKREAHTPDPATPAPMGAPTAEERDTQRCAVCGWPLDPAGKRCVRGNCSMRPLPDRLYDAARAVYEYGRRSLADLRVAYERWRRADP